MSFADSLGVIGPDCKLGVYKKSNTTFTTAINGLFTMLGMKPDRLAMARFAIDYAEKEKGWSKAAKGAVIGGVAGAAGGAILNKKNRVLGAVIGGVVGAAGGYGIGRGMDKKDGRIEINP